MKKQNPIIKLFVFFLICISITYVFCRAQNYYDKKGILDVSDFCSYYCIRERQISFKLKNISNEDIWIAIFVEVKKTDNKWHEFCPDIHQSKISEKLIGYPVPKGAIKNFIWDPNKAGKLYLLEPGRYRIVTYVNCKDEVPGRKIVLGEFDLIKCPK